MDKIIDEIIVSTDVEVNGNVPGIHSLWSIGAAAFSIEREGDKPTAKLLSTFEVNLEELPDATFDPGSMEFWKKHPEAWRHARSNQHTPEAGMLKLEEWTKQFDRKLMYTAWPATFDIPFLTYYSERFLKRQLLLKSGMDLRSYAFASFKATNWDDMSMRNLPEGFLPDNDKKHYALPDAIAQGYMACNIIMANLT